MRVQIARNLALFFLGLTLLIDIIGWRGDHVIYPFDAISFLGIVLTIIFGIMYLFLYLRKG